MGQWLALAMRRDVVVRSLRVSLLIGSLLVAINQGQHIIAGQWSSELVLRVVLTYCVPYGVSTYAAVQAIRQRR